MDKVTARHPGQRKAIKEGLVASVARPVTTVNDESILSYELEPLERLPKHTYNTHCYVNDFVAKAKELGVVADGPVGKEIANFIYDEAYLLGVGSFGNIMRFDMNAEWIYGCRCCGKALGTGPRGCHYARVCSLCTKRRGYGDTYSDSDGDAQSEGDAYSDSASDVDSDTMDSDPRDDDEEEECYVGTGVDSKEMKERYPKQMHFVSHQGTLRME